MRRRPPAGTSKEIKKGPQLPARPKDEAGRGKSPGAPARELELACLFIVLACLVIFPGRTFVRHPFKKHIFHLDK
jgi:hypothetical protein